MRKFGLLGKNIDYSFSRGYFTEKFAKEKLADHTYVNFDHDSLSDFLEQLLQETDLVGFNITIPYKQEIIPHLHSLSPQAEKIGAVNTVKITPEGLHGHNTDAFGFEQALLPLLQEHHKKALILGTGGASKAVAYVFEQLGIDYTYVSRTAQENGFTYAALDQAIIDTHPIIVNCTPLGTFPNIDNKPDIPYGAIGPKHLLYDLIYNPEKTRFLRLGEQNGAQIRNGLPMLIGQAEKAWKIWNS